MYALSLRRMHGEFRLVSTISASPTLHFTLSLARLRASGSGRKRVGVRLSGSHQSPGELGDEGESEGD